MGEYYFNLKDYKKSKEYYMMALSKYPPANRPKSPANKLNSEDNNGDRVAVIALKRQDKKYPQANTKKITTAFFIGKTFFSINLD